MLSKLTNACAVSAATVVLVPPLRAQLPAPGPHFPLAQSLVGVLPAGIAAGDFDHDGVLDLATANFGAPSALSVLRGLGGATFAPALAVAAGAQAHDLAAGDWDGDGHADLALAADAGAWTVVTLGGGAFAAAVQHASGGAPRGIAAGDANGDGRLDLLLTNGNTASIGALLGAGDGSFGAALVSSCGSTPRGITAGDFDGDGRLDVALTHDPGASFSVLRGRSNGTFHALSTQAVAPFAYALASADADLDGDLDLAIVHDGSPLDIALGDGAGGFSLAAPLGASAGDSFGLAWIDLDADGDPDLVVPGSASVHANVGAGAFAPAVDIQLRGTDAVAADLDADGTLDLAVADGGSAVGVALGTSSVGSPSFEGAQHVSTFFGGAFALGTEDLAVGDVDGDGWLDVVASSSNTTDALALLLGDGGTLGAPAALPLVGAPGDVGLADLDGNGWLDVVLCNGAAPGLTLAARFGTGNGGFAPAIAWSGAGVGNAAGLALADLDGDGDTDAVVTAKVPGGGGIYLNQAGALVASASFAVPAAPFTGFTPPIEPVDLDGDGDLDLLVGAPTSGPSGGVSVLAGAGDGSFAFGQFVAGGAGFVGGAVASGDIDGDGDADVALSHHTEGARILDGTGTLGLAPALSLGLGALPPLGALADVDGDGKLDLVCGGLRAIARGQTGLAFGAPSWFAQPYQGSEWIYPTVELADLDGNGALDVVAGGIYATLSRWSAPLVTSVGGLFAGAAGELVIHGAWLDGASVQVDGASVPLVAQSPSSLSLAVPSAVPGWKDLAITTPAGASAHAGVLPRWPALAASPAHVGGLLELALANGTSGTCVLGIAAQPGAPLALPGVWHALELAGPTVVQALAIGPTGEAALVLGIPADPTLAGAGAWFQCWAAQSGGPGAPTQSFSNALHVLVLP